MKSIVCWKGGTRKNKNASNRQLKKAKQTETQQRKQEKKIMKLNKEMLEQAREYLAGITIEVKEVATNVAACRRFGCGYDYD